MKRRGSAAADAIDVAPTAVTSSSGSRRRAKAPAEWVPRGTASFRGWVSGVLGKGAGAAAGLMDHQRRVRDFLGGGSPYRGLLLYHGLGSGKSCAAAAVAEAVARMGTEAPGGRAVVVLLPASLRPNFEAEMDKCAGAATRDGAHYFSTNGLAAKDVDAGRCVVKGVSLHGATVIVDEVHNLVSQASNGGGRGSALYEAIVGARGCKVVLLSGTPIINAPHELAYIFNMLHGRVRTLAFYEPAVSADAAAALLGAHGGVAAYVHDGDAVRVLPVAEGFRWTEGRRAVAVAPGGLAYLANPNDAALLAELTAALGAKRARRLNSDLFPADREAFERAYVRREGAAPVRNLEGFQSRVSGLISYKPPQGREDAKAREAARKDGFPEVVYEPLVRLPMTDMQYEMYAGARKLEVEKELRMRRLRNVGDGAEESGVYRAFSRAVCNWAFAKAGDRLFPSDMRAMMREIDTGEAAAGAEEGNLKRATTDAYKAALARSMAALGTAELVTDLAAHSPKMAAIAAAVDKGPGPALVYSEFRAVEGLGIFAKVLEARGYARVAFTKAGVRKAAAAAAPRGAKTFVVFDSTDPGNEHALRHFNSAGSPVDVILISKSASEGINLTGVRQVHVMEPYWNEVRVQQVVGRAARTKSHLHLPLKDREVRVYRYVVTLSKPEHRANRTLETVDGNLTSDEAVLRIAQEKMRVVDAFLEAVAGAAIDCDRAVGGVVRCMPSGATYDPFATADHTLLHVRRDGKDYILDPDTAVLYDFAAYNEGKRLVPIKTVAVK